MSENSAQVMDNGTLGTETFYAKDYFPKNTLPKSNNGELLIQNQNNIQTENEVIWNSPEVKKNLSKILILANNQKVL